MESSGRRQVARSGVQGVENCRFGGESSKFLVGGGVSRCRSSVLQTLRGLSGGHVDWATWRCRWSVLGGGRRWDWRVRSRPSASGGPPDWENRQISALGIAVCGLGFRGWGPKLWVGGLGFKGCDGVELGKRV